MHKSQGRNRNDIKKKDPSTNYNPILKTLSENYLEELAENSKG